LNLLILTEEDRLSDQHFAVSGKRRRHIINILRAAEGDTLGVGFVDGPTGSGTIECFEESKIVTLYITQCRSLMRASKEIASYNHKPQSNPILSRPWILASDSL
jgi:16S rRNA U1498 N3-methylase RsmE